MGFGFGGKKGNSRKRLGVGAVRPIGRRVKPIDRNGRRLGRNGEVQPIDRPITGVSGVKGRVGKRVKTIDKGITGADSVFSAGF